MNSRRDFLRTIGGAAGLWLATAKGAFPAISASQRTRSPRRVIVIGAGLAGLSAAYELNRAGHDVTVLEARAIPGGRVRTLRDGFSDGLYAEAGGQAFYPSADNYAAKYIDEFGLQRLPPGPADLAPVWRFREKTIRSQTGSAVQWPLDLTRAEHDAGLAGIRKTYLTPAVEQLASLVNVSEIAWPAKAVDAFDKTSFRQLLESRGASPAAIELLRIVDNDYIGEGADAYSAVEMLGQLYNVTAANRYLRGAFLSIAGGNDLLPRAFADRLGNRVRYTAAVSRIERSDSVATVHFTRSGREESLAAEYVVCAIPFSVLRTIPVNPPFSREKATAIRELSYASIARTYIQCRNRFWVRQGLSGFASTDLATTYFWDSTGGQPGPRGILHGYIMGSHARTFTRLSPSERRAFALEQAARVFPTISAEAESVTSVSWNEEVWSRGAYAFLRPGDASRLFPHLSSPEGRIHFAGEHTSTWFLHGSMQGALESGIRAAHTINDLSARRA